MSEDPLLTVVYVSSATDRFREADIPDLLGQSRRKNERLGVTGLLLYEGGNIIQILEGPAASVEPLVERIREDPRHTGVTVLLKEPVRERRFPNWSMGYRQRLPVAAEDAPAVSDYLRERLQEASGPQDRVERLLRVFRRVVQLP